MQCVANLRLLKQTTVLAQSPGVTFIIPCWSKVLLMQIKGCIVKTPHRWGGDSRMCLTYPQLSLESSPWLLLRSNILPVCPWQVLWLLMSSLWLHRIIQSPLYSLWLGRPSPQRSRWRNYGSQLLIDQGWGRKGWKGVLPIALLKLQGVALQQVPVHYHKLPSAHG